MRSKKYLSVNENWVKTSDLKYMKKEAEKASLKQKEIERGSNFVYVPHPTIPKTFIRKIAE